jgi:hypothetical protein
MSTQSINDTWIQVKIRLSLPFPLRNHFYKSRRISLRKNWFCKSCLHIFDLKPWSKYRGLPPADLKCPHCGSSSIIWWTKVFKAIIDKKSSKFIGKLT